MNPAIPTWISVSRSRGAPGPPAASASTHDREQHRQHEAVELEVDRQRRRELDPVERDQPEHDHERRRSSTAARGSCAASRRLRREARTRSRGEPRRGMPRRRGAACAGRASPAGPRYRRPRASRAGRAAAPSSTASAMPNATRKVSSDDLRRRLCALTTSPRAWPSWLEVELALERRAVARGPRPEVVAQRGDGRVRQPHRLGPGRRLRVDVEDRHDRVGLDVEPVGLVRDQDLVGALLAVGLAQVALHALGEARHGRRASRPGRPIRRAIRSRTGCAADQVRRTASPASCSSSKSMFSDSASVISDCGASTQHMRRGGRRSRACAPRCPAAGG